MNTRTLERLIAIGNRRKAIILAKNEIDSAAIKIVKEMVKEKHGLTKSQIADTLGVSRQTIYDWINL